MNVFCFTGNLGSDPQVKVLPTGTAVTNFSVAVKCGWGERESTLWVNCALWGSKDGAPNKLTEYLSTGTKVSISGELSLREWEVDGRSGSSLDCRVGSIDISRTQPAAPKPAKPKAQEPVIPMTNGVIDPIEEDDIPF